MPSHKVKMPLAQAEALAAEFIEKFLKPHHTKIQIAGSIRRKEKIVGDIDIVVEGPVEHLIHNPELEHIQGEMLLMLVWKGQQFNVLHAKSAEWGAALFYLTGPQGSTIGYRMKAKNNGWLLNSHGLYDQTGKMIAGDTEESIYTAFGKPFKPPEKRGK